MNFYEPRPWANNTLVSMLFWSGNGENLHREDAFHYYRDYKEFRHIPDPARCNETEFEYDLYTSLMVWNKNLAVWEKAI